MADELAHRPTHYLIKSDWKLHDIIKKIETILEIPNTPSARSGLAVTAEKLAVIAIAKEKI